MRAKFGRCPTAGSKKLPFKFIIGVRTTNWASFNFKCPVKRPTQLQGAQVRSASCPPLGLTMYKRSMTGVGQMFCSVRVSRGGGSAR